MSGNALPQLDGALLLTDSGLETVLIYLDGIDLPDFASFAALRRPDGRAAVERYFRSHLEVAARLGTGFVLESPTWRSSPDWGTRQVLDIDQLAALNVDAVAMMSALRDEYRDRVAPILVSGCVGPRGDAYRSDGMMTPGEAYDYHRWQIRVLVDAGVDMVTALTLTYAAEAIGIVNAAVEAGLPVVISFTVETDGRLPDGTSLADAIDAVDAATGNSPAYYMVNCAHPIHLRSALEVDGSPRWLRRLSGLRANASTRSHAELDAAAELDSGDPADLAGRYADLRIRFPQLTVLGGCCGTDIRHIEAIAAACVGPATPTPQPDDSP